MPIGHLYVLFGEMSINIYVFCPFFDWVVFWSFLILSCMNCVYILEIKPLFVAFFANIFSQLANCLLFMVSFGVQKFMFVVSFVDFYFFWETDLRKYCNNLCQTRQNILT